MSLIKKVIPILIFLLVVSIAWIGFSIYFQSTGIDIDPKAKDYTESINPSFDTEVLEEISSKTEESFPVSPDEFLKLNEID